MCDTSVNDKIPVTNDIITKNTKNITNKILIILILLNKFVFTVVL